MKTGLAIRPRTAIVAALALFLVIGCANSNAPTSANFSVGISKYLRQGGNGRICYTMSHVFPLDVFRGRPGYGYYNPINQDNENVGSGTMDHLHQFVVAGLVATTNVRTPTEDTNGGTFMYPAVRYALTTLGRRLIFSGNSSQNAQICYADVTVKKVINFTLPGQEHGETISTIQWQADAIPDRGLDSLFHAGKLPFLQQYAASQISSVRSGRAVLTNRGWEYNPGD
ncbi:MAG: hypothetical protein PXZ07_06325 [Candidatus Eremiobacteraeota bacterium]|nr:hypothetical protein [Candidatus Eremiobacteraeota bacterium]